MTDKTQPDSGRATGGIVEMLHARIAELEARVQELGAMARENRSRRIVELEAQLAAVGAGGGQALSAAPAVQGVPGNFITHRAAWREALETAKANAAGDDVSYWDHELRAFDRSFDRLWELMQASPTPPAEQPIGELVVTKTRDGQIVSVTRQDDEGRILSVIATCDSEDQQAVPKAAPGEPVNGWPVEAKIYKRRDEWVLELSGVINDCAFTCRHTQPGYLQPEDVAGLPSIYSEGTAPQPAPAPAPLSRNQIREVSMAHGFTIKEGQTDLKQYVYDAAHALLELVASPQQEAQEPHGWLYEWTHSSATGKPDSTYTAFTTDEAHARKHDNCRAIYTAPQPSPTTKPAPQQEAQEPFGYVTTHSKTGQQVFYRYPDPPYLDNASECVTVYTAPQPAPAPLSDDARRLDWMDKDNGKRVVHLVNKWYTRPSYGQPYRKHASLRDAIDAALAAQQQ